MSKGFLVLCCRLLICLTAICALPACVSQYTVLALHDLNSAAEVVDTCVRIPTGEAGTSVYAFKRNSRVTVSDRDRDKFEQFAKTADIFYRYDPNAPRQTSPRLPWPYQHMTCDTVSSPDTPPLPKGMLPIPISPAMREALVASLSEQYFLQPVPLAAELKNQPMEKRFLAQPGPRLMTLPPTQSKEKFDEVSQILRDAIRGSLPTVERRDVHGPTGEQISIIDTKTGHIIAGLASGAPSFIVPGWGLITDGIMAADTSRQPTREFIVSKSGVEAFAGLGQMFVGGSMALGGTGATITGGGALVGVPVCVAGVALATNGAITFYNGSRTLILAVCHWNELPSAANAQPLAATSTNSAPQSAGPAPAATQSRATTPKAPEKSLTVQEPVAKGAKPATQQATSTPSTGQTPAPAPKGRPGGIKSGKNTTTWYKCTGQMHHGITSKIHTALEKHPLLKGLYKYRDDRFVTQALNKEAHRGYQKWHRDMETQVVDWIRDQQKATPAQFEAWLRNLYKTEKELSWRFPNGF